MCSLRRRTNPNQISYHLEKLLAVLETLLAVETSRRKQSSRRWRRCSSRHANLTTSPLTSWRKSWLIEIVSKESDRTPEKLRLHILSIKCQQQLGNSEQCSSDDVTGIWWRPKWWLHWSRSASIVAQYQTTVGKASLISQSHIRGQVACVDRPAGLEKRVSCERS